MSSRRSVVVPDLILDVSLDEAARRMLRGVARRAPLSEPLAAALRTPDDRLHLAVGDADALVRYLRPSTRAQAQAVCRSLDDALVAHVCAVAPALTRVEDGRWYGRWPRTHLHPALAWPSAIGGREDRGLAAVSWRTGPVEVEMWAPDAVLALVVAARVDALPSPRDVAQSSRDAHAPTPTRAQHLLDTVFDWIEARARHSRPVSPRRTRRSTRAVGETRGGPRRRRVP